MGLFLAVWLLVMILTACGREQPVTFCDDRAGLLDESRRERLRNYHRKLLEDADIHLLLVTLDRAAPDLDREAVALFEKYRVGASAAGARGVLLVVDPAGLQVRMEIGYALEGIFPDGFVAMIEHEQLAPFFAAERVADGIEATVELLVARALGSREPADSNRVSGERLSGGGGARIDVAIGGGQTATSTGNDAQGFAAGASPAEAMDGYLRVLAGRVKDPELPLYTPETRAMLRKWLVTDAQQANEWRTLSGAVSRGEWHTAEHLAVLRFPLDERRLPPYFFRKGPQGWMLDLTAMSQLLGFNHLNQWHFRTLEHPFRFAFRNVTFDANGYPQPVQ